FDKSSDLQQHWLTKLKNASDETTDRHRRRMEFISEHGYLLAFLHEEHSTAYDQMIQASEEYKKANLTPAEERSIRETIGSTPVDYEPQEVLDSKVYHVGSIVLPVKDPSGRYTMTLRLAQLPSSATGAKVQVWIGEAKAVIEQLEQSKESN